MADLPLKKDKKANDEPIQNKIEVTDENAAKLTVHFLSQIYARLGYIVKLLEDKK